MNICVNKHREDVALKKSRQLACVPTRNIDDFWRHTRRPTTNGVEQVRVGGQFIGSGSTAS